MVDIKKCLTLLANLLLIFNLVKGQYITEKPRKGPSVNFSHGALKVSDNNRFLVHSDDTPFLYLGDTPGSFFTGWIGKKQKLI